MDPKSQERFDQILGKLNNKEHLTPENIAFLRARRSYLSKWQRVLYADILYFNKQYLIYKATIAGKWLVTVFLFQLAINLVIELIKSYIFN